MKKGLILIFTVWAGLQLSAQHKLTSVRVGLFTSLYLDAAFDASGNYQLKNNFPRQSIPGLEFYEGAVMAIDSMNKVGVTATLEVFDLQIPSGKPAYLLEKGKFDSLDLIVAQVGGAEYLQLARIAKEKNIPMVSASYPNDGGIRSSSMVYIANPRISSHMEVISGQIQKKWPQANVIWFREDNAADAYLESLFKKTSWQGIKQPLRTVILKRPFLTEDISKWIDTVNTNVLIAGSLDDGFATEFARAVSTYDKKGVIQLVGMPNWDGLKEIQLKQYTGIPIYYTTAHFIPPGHDWSTRTEEYFRSQTSAKPSSSVFKGFELTYYFSNLLYSYGNLEKANLEDNKYKVLNDLDFRPVVINPDSGGTDFFENKRIYFIRRLNSVGSIQ